MSEGDQQLKDAYAAAFSRSNATWSKTLGQRRRSCHHCVSSHHKLFGRGSGCETASGSALCFLVNHLLSLRGVVRRQASIRRSATLQAAHPGRRCSRGRRSPRARLPPLFVVESFASPIPMCVLSGAVTVSALAVGVFLAGIRTCGAVCVRAACSS
jgi:hypothetical protein